MQTNGFPNCFFLGFTQTAVTVSVPMALNEQAKHIVHMITEARTRGSQNVEATLEGEDAWVAEVRRAARLGVKFYTECTPGYYNNEGKLGSPLGFFAGMYGEGPIKMYDMLERWREDGRLEGVDVY